MVECNTPIFKVKIRKISVLKLSYLFLFFGILFGILGGFPFFVAVRSLIEGWGMTNVPVLGLSLLSFLFFPIINGFIFWLLGLLIGLFANLFLKMIKGLNMFCEITN